MNKLYTKLKFIKQSFYLILKFSSQHIGRKSFLSYYFWPKVLKIWVKFKAKAETKTPLFLGRSPNFGYHKKAENFSLPLFFIYACVLTPLGNDVGSLKALDMHKISLKKKIDLSISKSTGVKKLRKRWMNNSHFMGERTWNEWSDKWLNLERIDLPNFCVYCQIQVLQQQVHKGGCWCVTVTFMRFASARSLFV